MKKDTCFTMSPRLMGTRIPVALISIPRSGGETRRGEARRNDRRAYQARAISSSRHWTGVRVVALLRAYHLPDSAAAAPAVK